MDHLDDADKLLVKLTKFVPPVFSFIYSRDSQMHESPRWPETRQLVTSPELGDLSLDGEAVVRSAGPQEIGSLLVVLQSLLSLRSWQNTVVPPCEQCLVRSQDRCDWLTYSWLSRGMEVSTLLLLLSSIEAGGRKRKGFLLTASCCSAGERRLLSLSAIVFLLQPASSNVNKIARKNFLKNKINLDASLFDWLGRVVLVTWGLEW